MTTPATSPSAEAGTLDIEDPKPDGRRLRRERNRQAVVDALLGLYADGNLRPSSAEIAERAGLSPRSLFRYFDDVDDLCRAAIECQLLLARPLSTSRVGDGAPRRERVASLVDQRVRLFAAVRPAATVCRLEAPFKPALQDELVRSRAFLRDQIGQVLEPELAASGDRASEVLAAADVLLSFEAFQLLHDQGLSSAAIRQVLSWALEVLVAGSSRPS